MKHYDEEVVQLTSMGLAVEWVARTQIESSEPCGTVVITQDGDEVVVPWCYVNDIIKALEEAKDAARLHRDNEVQEPGRLHLAGLISTARFMTS